MILPSLAIGTPAMLRTFLLCWACLVLPTTLYAKIINPITLEQVVKDQPLIFTAKVTEVLPEKPGMIFVPVDKLRGEFPFERVPVNLTGDNEAAKEKQTAVLLDRIEKDTTLILFAIRIGKTYKVFAYTNGTWFGMEGKVEQQDGKDVTRWQFTHTEPYFRRTFKGTTDELIKAIQGGIKGEKLPPYNEKEEPGYGPPLKKAKEKEKGEKGEKGDLIPPAPFSEAEKGEPNQNLATRSVASISPLSASERGAGGGRSAALAVDLPLGVIQLPFLGLIAALAALFPAVFGGLAIFMRRWVAALSIAGFVSMLVAVAMYFPKWIAWAGIKNLSTTWFVAAGLSAVGALWAGYRYRRAIRDGRSDEYQPRYLDRIGLVIMAALIALGIGVGVMLKESLKESPWLELVVLLVPVVACAYFVLAHWLRDRGDAAKPVGISAESVGLWAGMSACLVAGLVFMTRGSDSGLSVIAGKSGIKLEEQHLWLFEPKEGGEVLASPVVTTDRVFVNVHHRQGFAQYGRVYALERETGKVVWEYDADGDLKPLFCSPTFADGKLFFGEGYHTDRDSKMYCLDATTGKQLWAFQTTSHTEATPSVLGDSVIFGAGDDGVYCVNIADGQKRWQYKGETTVHVDSNPLIHDGKIYGGSGTSQKNKVNRIFCLDAKTGNEIWGERVEYSAWGSPSAVGQHVYFATGNGTYSEDRPPVAGLILCRDAATGKPIWERALPNSVVAKPAVDRYQAYVGCRDGKVYALDRFTGEIVWSQSVNSPVLAAPTLVVNPEKRIGEVLYVMSSTGTLLALSPTDGGAYWATDFRSVVQKGHVNTVAIPAAVPEKHNDNISRRLFIGLGMADNASSTPTARLYCYRDVNGE